MGSDFSHEDVVHMRRALTLARRGQGNVEPNPMVGAVVVKEGKVIGEGFHRKYGGPHAEVWALIAAGEKARGGTLYVTLEPCCHFGKTPPCTDAISRAGVARVVAAMIDPFSEVAGKGAEILRNRGMQVDVGLLEEEARSLNAPFLTRVERRRPFVIAKWAQSLDGCIATAAGESKWISSAESREIVQQLRGRMDGIIVGIGTALKDDPLLMARPSAGRYIRRLATRIVVDSECRLPMSSQLVRTIASAPLLVVHKKGLSGVAEKRRATLAGKGVGTVGVAVDRGGGLKIGAILKHLAAFEYTNVLLEGGGELMAAFFHGGFVDEAHVFVAPMVIGGKNAKHAVMGADLAKLAAAKKMAYVGMERCGADVHLRLRKM